MIDMEFIRTHLNFDEKTEHEIYDRSLTEHGERVLRVIEGLKRNFKKYGAAYCPCKPNHIPENICPCKDHIETGRCICGLLK